MKKMDFSALSYLFTGTGIGAYGIGSFIATGMICPACIILTPTLIGYGFYKYKTNKNGLNHRN
jgi:hypothetical protein